MAFSHIKIKAARVGNATEVLVNGEKPPGLLGVQFDSNVGNATMVTLKMFAAVEAEGEADCRRIVICPKCREEQHGNRLILNPLLKWRRRFKGIWQAARLMFAWGYKPNHPEVTEMGDENRKYIP
jgi:hypothetical protein